MLSLLELDLLQCASFFLSQRYQEDGEELRSVKERQGLQICVLQVKYLRHTLQWLLPQLLKALDDRSLLLMGRWVQCFLLGQTWACLQLIIVTFLCFLYLRKVSFEENIPASLLSTMAPPLHREAAYDLARLLLALTRYYVVYMLLVLLATTRIHAYDLFVIMAVCLVPPLLHILLKVVIYSLQVIAFQVFALRRMERRFSTGFGIRTS